jgi:phenylacetic acid degradation operon negative regulatory protein
VTYFYHAVVDSPHLPRDLEHDSAPNLLVNLLGEFWDPVVPRFVPSSAIVELMLDMGATEAAVRAALSRLTKKGTLDVVRTGRRTAYALSEEFRMSIPYSEILTLSFGKNDREWSGQWTIVVFSLPETQRDTRQSLRDRLRWLGFGPVRDGVWVAPHADISLAQQTLNGFLPPDGLIFTSASLTCELDPFAVWPLTELRATYESFIGDCRPHVYRLRDGAVSPREALRLALAVLGRWRSFPTVDPDLPAASMPADWPRREARRLFEEVFDASIPLAAMHVTRVVAKHSEECARLVRGLRVQEALTHFQEFAAKKNGCRSKGGVVDQG